MHFKLTKEQETCLKDAEGQPVGRKGEKWLEWANSKLKRAGLSAVVVSTPGSKATPSAKAALVLELPAEKRTRTFVVQSGVLKSDSMTFKFNTGMLTGYFQVGVFAACMTVCYWLF
jgi:hypothetical protein